MDNAIELAEGRLEYTRLLWRSIDDDTVTHVDPTGYIRAMARASYRCIHRPSNPTFSEIQATGALSTLPEALRENLTRHYAVQHVQGQFDNVTGLSRWKGSNVLQES